MQHRTTPELITSLQPNEVFVFGSNLAGIHDAGAAKQALQFGAKTYIPYNLCGQTFGIPTKNQYIKTMPLIDIEHYVLGFIEIAKKSPMLTFLVTKIGCGLAEYTPNDIARLFKDAINIGNIHLPLAYALKEQNKLNSEQTDLIESFIIDNLQLFLQWKIVTQKVMVDICGVLGIDVNTLKTFEKNVYLKSTN